MFRPTNNKLVVCSCSDRRGRARSTQQVVDRQGKTGMLGAHVRIIKVGRTWRVAKILNAIGALGPTLTQKWRSGSATVFLFASSTRRAEIASAFVR